MSEADKCRLYVDVKVPHVIVGHCFVETMVGKFSCPLWPFSLLVNPSFCVNKLMQSVRNLVKLLNSFVASTTVTEKEHRVGYFLRSF